MFAITVSSLIGMSCHSIMSHLLVSEASEGNMFTLVLWGALQIILAHTEKSHAKVK